MNKFILLSRWYNKILLYYINNYIHKLSRVKIEEIITFITCSILVR